MITIKGMTPTNSPAEIFGLLCDAETSARPSLRYLRTARWVMNLDWYKALRRAALPPDLPPDDEARDETRWEPDPGDMVLGRYIVVTEDGGAPRLADGLMPERGP